MNYTVEIVLAETLDPTDEKGIPTIRLQERFSTVDQATDTARAFIKNLERPTGLSLLSHSGSGRSGY